MIIENIHRGTNQLRATIQWDCAQRDSFEAYFRHGDKAADEWMGQCIAHPFLIAAILPAMRHGEKRIRVEREPVDPFLLDQLRSVSALAHAWWGDGTKYEPVELEVDVAESIDPPSEDRVTASFLTGGVDSLATLRNNRLNIPRSHPKSIEKNIFVHGMEIGLGGRASEDEDASKRKFQETCQALSPIVSSAGTELVPIYTNIRHLYGDNSFYTKEWYSSILGAVSHFISRKVNTMYVGSAFDYPNLRKRASHPLMQSLFSGASIQVIQDGGRLSRFEKVKLLTSWSEAISNLRVCFVNRPGELNCGECEKCIRTKLELAAAGALENSGAFKEKDISSEDVSELSISGPYAALCMKEIIEPLQDHDYGEVAGAVEAKLRQYRATRRRVEERDWRGVIKRGLRALNLYQ